MRWTSTIFVVITLLCLNATAAETETYQLPGAEYLKVGDKILFQSAKPLLVDQEIILFDENKKQKINNFSRVKVIQKVDEFKYIVQVIKQQEAKIKVAAKES